VEVPAGRERGVLLFRWRRWGLQSEEWAGNLTYTGRECWAASLYQKKKPLTEIAIAYQGRVSFDGKSISPVKKLSSPCNLVKKN